MDGSDERGETASLFGLKPQVLLGFFEINFHAPTQTIGLQHLFGAQLKISGKKQSPVLAAGVLIVVIQAAHEQQFHRLPAFWLALILFKIQLYRTRDHSPRQICDFASLFAYRLGIQLLGVQQHLIAICLEHAIFKFPLFMHSTAVNFSSSAD